MTINEPNIMPDDILNIKDEQFNPNNVCIVTGCGTGIGRALAVAAAANDLTVAGIDVNVDAGKQTEEMAMRTGGRMTFIHADLTDDGDIERSVNEAADFGNIKFLSNIAGIQHIDSIENFPMDRYDTMQRLMLRAPFYLSKLAIPHMKASPGGTGVIANMASIHAHICTLNKPVYNITKFGLRALSQSISAEGEGKIRSFSISTGFVQTPLAMNQVPAQAKQRGITEEQVITDVMMGKSRIKRMMTPIEVANIFIYGFSRHAAYLVGADLLFDGGCVLTY